MQGKKINILIYAKLNLQLSFIFHERRHVDKIQRLKYKDHMYRYLLLSFYCKFFFFYKNHAFLLRRVPLNFDFHIVFCFFDTHISLDIHEVETWYTLLIIYAHIYLCKYQSIMFLSILHIEIECPLFLPFFTMQNFTLYIFNTFLFPLNK